MKGLITMKKIINILAFGICIVLLASFGISSLAASVNAVSPNRGYFEDRGNRQVYGHVQAQPSYNDGGRHAQVGWLYFFGSYKKNPSEALVSNRYQETYKYTNVGASQSDTRLLIRNYTFQLAIPSDYDYVKKPPLYIYTKYDFFWQPHTSGDIPWTSPLGNSPIVDPS